MSTTKRAEAIFIMDKEDVGGGIRAKGERDKDKFYGSLYIPHDIAQTHTKFKVTVEAVESDG